MAGALFNDAAIIQSGMSLVPNLRDQLIQDSLLKMQKTEFEQAQQDRAAQQAAAAQAQAKQAEFQTALEDLMSNPTPQKALALQIRFPEFAKQYSSVFDSLDEDVRRTNVTQMDEIHRRLLNNDISGAIEKLRRRVEADRAAGLPDDQDNEVLAALESGDPTQIKIATGTVMTALALSAPKEYAEVYGKLNPTEATPATIREYDARVAKFGKPAADAWLATQDAKLLAVNPGGTVFQLGGGTVPQGAQPAAQGGGDPSGSGALGLTPEQFRANVDALGPQRAAALTSKNGIPVRVRSVQEANALPPGTLYATPTGELYTR